MRCDGDLHIDASRIHLLGALGRLYACGAQPALGKLYERVAWPVPPGTPALASSVRWDHGIEWAVADFSGANRSGENVIEVDLSRNEDAYLAGHEIDGRILFPATGYLVSYSHTISYLMCDPKIYVLIIV